MKTIYISNRQLSEMDFTDMSRYEDYLQLLNEYKTMESHVIYFSAGDAKIKEILIRKEPAFSA